MFANFLIAFHFFFSFTHACRAVRFMPRSRSRSQKRNRLNTGVNLMMAVYYGMCGNVLRNIVLVQIGNLHETHIYINIQASRKFS